MDRSEIPGAEPRVGYVLKMFPRLSETFVLNELLELERRGLRPEVYSLRLPDDGRFHGRVADLRLTAQYFPRDRPESTWTLVQGLPREIVPPLERWDAAMAFLREHSIPGELDLLLRSVLIAARARRQGIQHLHAHFATVAARVAAISGTLAGIPFSFTAHAKDIYRDTVDWRLFEDLLRRAAFCITVSDYNRAHIVARVGGAAAAKVLRLYNGIDLDFFSPGERSDTGLPIHVVSVGRLVPKKGFDVLLRALRRCKDDGLEFRATLVGEGEQRQALLALRDALGLGVEVTLPGALTQEQVRDTCRDATLMALACVPDADGNMDALPTTLLEALALDVPVVSTRLAGVPEIVGDDAGVLVEPGDPVALADAICRVANEVRSGSRVRGTCRARAERLFDLRRNVDTLAGRFGGSAAIVETAS